MGESSRQNTIVVIEDHRIVREGIIGLLETQDWLRVIGSAGDGLEGFTKVRQLQPDIAVVDLALPGLNGIELLSRLTKLEKRPHVITLTSSQDPSRAREALRLGAGAYVVKDDAFEDLITAIQYVLDGRSYISPAISGLLWKQMEKESDQRAASGLSPREAEILGLIGHGLTDKEIAARLGLATTTVRTHRSRVREKLDLHTPAELVRYAIEHGLA